MVKQTIKNFAEALPRANLEASGGGNRQETAQKDEPIDRDQAKVDELRNLMEAGRHDASFARKKQLSSNAAAQPSNYMQQMHHMKLSDRARTMLQQAMADQQENPLRDLAKFPEMARKTWDNNVLKPKLESNSSADSTLMIASKLKEVVRPPRILFKPALEAVKMTNQIDHGSKSLAAIMKSTPLSDPVTFKPGEVNDLNSKHRKKTDWSDVVALLDELEVPKRQKFSPSSSLMTKENNAETNALEKALEISLPAQTPFKPALIPTNSNDLDESVGTFKSFQPGDIPSSSQGSPGGQEPYLGPDLTESSPPFVADRSILSDSSLNTTDPVDILLTKPMDSNRGRFRPQAAAAAISDESIASLPNMPQIAANKEKFQPFTGGNLSDSIGDPRGSR